MRAQIAREKSNGDWIIRHDPMLALMLIFNAINEDNQRVSILSAVSNSVELKGDVTSKKSSITIENSKYYTVASLLWNIKSFPRSLNAHGTGAVFQNSVADVNMVAVVVVEEVRDRTGNQLLFENSNPVVVIVMNTVLGTRII